MNKQNKKPRSDDMYEAILTLKTVDECKRFFDDLCTVTELQAMEPALSGGRISQPGHDIQRHFGAHRGVERDDFPGKPQPAVRLGRLCRRL